MYELSLIEGEGWRRWRTIFCRRAIRRYFASGAEADLVIATTWNVARGLVGTARAREIPLVTVVHGLEVTRKMTRLKRKWLRRTLEKSTLVIAVSRFTRRHIIDQFGLGKGQCVVLPNGVDIERFYPDRDTSLLKQRLGLSNERIILTLARVIRRKGHDRVIAALPEIVRRFPDVKYIICGPRDDLYCRELEAQSESLGIADHVVFAGYAMPEELRLFYNLCDVYLMPSREIEGDTEGFGITYLEANACEKPVIGGDSGGVSDAISDGETGFIVDPADPRQIAGKTIMLLSNRELARRMGKNGRHRIEKGYTWDGIAERLIALIQS